MRARLRAVRVREDSAEYVLSQYSYIFILEVTLAC